MSLTQAILFLRSYMWCSPASARKAALLLFPRLQAEIASYPFWF